MRMDKGERVRELVKRSKVFEGQKEDERVRLVSVVNKGLYLKGTELSIDGDIEVVAVENLFYIPFVDVGDEVEHMDLRLVVG
jgi:hypothetical protein